VPPVQRSDRLTKAPQPVDGFDDRT